MDTWKKAVLGGAAAVLVLSTAGVAAATTDSGRPTPTRSTASPAPSSTSTATPDGAAHKQRREHSRQTLARRLMRVEHATWVTRAETGAFVTHQAIRGVVTAVSSTSLTVKAADGVTRRYAVNAQTKVRVRTATTPERTTEPTSPMTQPTPAEPERRAQRKGEPATIGDLEVGDRAAVVGTGDKALTATVVIGGLR